MTSGVTTRVVIGLVIGLTTLSLAALPAGVAEAAASGVSTCAGSGPGSLPDAISHATAGATITFSGLCPARSPIILTHTIEIDTSLTIEGPGPVAAVVNGGGDVTDFAVAPGVTATFSGLTIENGRSGSGRSDNAHSDNGAGIAGGIFNQGTSTVTDVTLSGNTGTGGAIVNQGILTVTNSTLADNSAVSGGGLYNDGTATVTNTTFWHNSATGGSADGGAIFNSAASLTIGATIIAASNPSGSDCSGVAGIFTDLGSNLDDDGTCGFHAGTDHSDVPAGLDPSGLRNNGGLTETIGLVPGSRAIGAIHSSSLCSTPDQRGVPRPTPCDIGAVDLTLLLQQITSADTATATAGSIFSVTVTTTGSPVPSITRSGALPKHLKFVNNGDGTATLSGTPEVAGIYPFLVKATFGQGKSKNVVSETFTLTVDPAA